MKADEFIAFARKLLTLPAARCPAGFRSVTSRLYFGAYLETLDFIENDLGFKHRKLDDANNKHLFVKEYLTGCGEPTAQDLAAMLGQLHDRRKSADYELTKGGFDTETFAIDSVVRADRIVKAIEKCREESVRMQIVAGMFSFRERRSASSSRIQ